MQSGLISRGQNDSLPTCLNKYGNKIWGCPSAVSEFLVGVGTPMSPTVVAPVMVYNIMLTPLKHKYN